MALTKRYDVLTKMMDSVKGYMKHEKETLFEVINLRKNMTIEEKNKENVYPYQQCREQLHSPEFRWVPIP